MLIFTTGIDPLGHLVGPIEERRQPARSIRGVLAVGLLAAAILVLASRPTSAAECQPTAKQDFLPAAPAWTGQSESLVVPSGDPWITPAEQTDLTDTPSYGETLAFLRRLEGASPLIRMQTFGRTSQGR